MNALVLKPLPFDNRERIAMLWQNRTQRPEEINDTAPANFMDWRDQNRSFEHLAAFSGTTFDLTEGGYPEEVQGMRVTPGFFEVLGRLPHGRTFVAEDVSAGQSRVAIISDGLWRRRFGSDPHIVGKQLRLSGIPHTIVGHARQGWYLISKVDVWIPLGWTASELRRDDHNLSVIGRRRPQVTFDQAQAEMDGIGRRLAQAYPTENTGYGVLLKPIGDVFPAQRDKRVVVALMLAVAFVLLIACVNVANLQLARANERVGETAIRLALGASTRRIGRQYLMESALLALIGGAVGLLLCFGGVHALTTNVALSGFWNPITLDRGVVLFTLAACAASALVFGVGPALHASCTNLNAMLRQDARTATTSRATRRFGRLLVTTEIVLAIVVLSMGADMVRGFTQLRNLKPGFDTSALVTMRVSLPAAQYTENQFSPTQTVTATFDKMTERIAAHPGVTGVSYMTVLPRSESNPRVRFTLPQQRHALGGDAPIASWRAVSVGFFAMMGIPVIEGREFHSHDTFGKALSIVINETLAHQLFGGDYAVGRELYVFDEPRTVVGVVGDVLLTLNAEPTPTIYLPHGQSPRLSMAFLVRTRGDLADVMSSLPSAVQHVDRSRPVTAVMPFEEYINLQFAGSRLTNSLLVVFCILALVIASMGLYGLISYSVSQRRDEFAIRMALGALPDHIFKLVSKEALALMAAGVLVASPALIAGRRILSLYLGEIVQNNWSTTLSVLGLIIVVGFLSSVLPALRAARIQPSTALHGA
jgi:putative ABC transport system permease protein